ncbi:connectin isoform X1 [Acyrthosiphon pisum]|uniref:Connectin n=1 Tax=Acyrthosiphon pisum TaxID=7029 RepID=A0A8R2JPV8_ACYPI|nr:connectin isoform X1 [Acyrthosiphon pisum]XP_029343585.1 connectin isoform X1 [Acyrthosiphon pisum]XP_029343586.1 connectin isoform X1 [Acyrthosiphon pisum]
MARQQQFIALWLVFAVLVYDNHGYVSNRRGKNQRPGVRSYPDDDKNGGGGVGVDINVCALEQKTTINLYCYCDDSKSFAATSADCWVFNDGEPRDSTVWREFGSQSNVTKLTFNVRGTSSKTLSFVPTEALALMPELRTLEIVYADIGTVHSHAFANLSRLQDLALVRNNIVQLARDSIAYMNDLRVVTLGDNAIESISNDVFARLPALRKLYMDRNNISYIAEGAFEQLRKLEELDLSDNRLTGSLSRYVFLGLVSVKRLDMRANHLDRVGPDAFAELVCLEELVLEDNVIKTIDGRGFSGLPSLQRLNLAENRLTALDDRTFHSLDKLKFIDIRYNNLQTLTFGAVEPILERLRNSTIFFHFKGNMFECDCSLLWMNRLAAEINNEQVKRELTTAQCQMNDTADSDLADLKVAGPRNVYGGDGGGYGANQVDAETTADKAISVGGGGMMGGADGGFPKSFDEPQVVAISSLNEDTCPGKEQPLVDGAPDAAQNSDRVLWESTKSASAAGSTLQAPLGRSALPVLALVFAIIIRSRRC